MAHERQGQNGLAVADFKRVLALDPDRAPRWHSKIGVLLEESAPTDARSHLLDALEVNPRDRAALEALCRIASKYPNVVEAAKPLQPDESKREASPSSDQGGAVK